MENQKLLDLVANLPEHEQNTIPLVNDDGILSENIINNYENDIDDLILMPEKVTDTEKQLALENTFEVIEDKGSKIFHDIKEDNEVINASKDEEKEHVLENSVVNAKIEDLATLQKIQFPKEEPIVSEKLETKNTDSTKTVTNQENESANMVQPEVKTVDIPEVISVASKKNTDEGDACDIKIGPEELFCRIGLGKILKFESIRKQVDICIIFIYNFMNLGNVCQCIKKFWEKCNLSEYYSLKI